MCFEFLSGNIAKSSRILILVSPDSLMKKDFFKLAWERNFDIILIEGIMMNTNIANILLKKTKQTIKNITIFSSLQDKQVLNCELDDSACLSHFICDEMWSPLKMLTKLRRNFMVLISSHLPYFEEKNGKFAGVDFELIKLMIPNWPVTYKVFPHGHNASQGVIYETLIIFLKNTNEADISIGGLWLTNDFPSSHPYARQCNTFLVHRPSLLPNSTFVFQYFQFYLWLSLLATLIIISFILKLAFSAYRLYSSFDQCFLILLQYTVNLGIPKFPESKQIYLRWILSVWLFSSLIIMTYFCAGLTTTLRFPRFTEALNLWQDLVTLNIRWMEKSEFYRNLIASWGPYDKNLKCLANLYQHVGDSHEMNKFLRNKYAIRVQVLPGFYMTNTEWIDEYGRKHYRLLEDCFLEYFNKKVLHVIEYGFVDYWFYSIQVEKEQIYEIIL
ncbi:hypothetical protein HHI36_011258 [Cryptolaemus montrouzieri]|uniref:Uncharacterized protein n=1 Tax=Cryptolaemus montrouzieri TaxID=559131 RepID=A0ABD2ML88_9CUCU